MGPSIKYTSRYVRPILTPLPCHTLSHISDPPIFSWPRTKKPPVQILSQIFSGFCPVFFSGVFCLEGFVRGGFCPIPLLSEYICYNRKLNITLNFMFQKCDVTCSLPISCHKLSQLLGSPPPRA